MFFLTLPGLSFLYRFSSVSFNYSLDFSILEVIPLSIFSTLIPINLAKTDMSPPNNKVETRTTTRVELTNKLNLGDNEGLICKLKAKAIAPLMVPLYQIMSSYLKLIPRLKQLNIPTNKAGRNTPKALAIIVESKTTTKN